MGTPYKYTLEFLAPIVAESTSVTDVVRRLGLRPNGGSHTHISRTIAKHGIDISHFQLRPTGGRRPRRDASSILVRQDPGSHRQKPSLLRRALLDVGVVYECSRCGNDGSWMGEPLTLEVDHIDGDIRNNARENLRFLCPNCHRLTPNFAGKSRGRFTGRSPQSPTPP